MAKVLITEKINPIGIEVIKNAGHEVIQMETLEESELKEKIKDVDAALVRILPITREILGGAKNLKILSKHGVGVDTFDIEAAKELGIALTTTPDANGRSVAEHAFALMMSLAKNIVPVSEEYKRIGFAAKNYKEGVEVTGKTLGIIGCGKIGRRMAKMAHNGFDMRVLVYDPYITEVPEGCELVSEKERVLSESDFISLHCYLSDETFHFIGKKEFALMKPTAYLINCARGPVVDEPALIDALLNEKLAGAGLDVTEAEPLDPESPLFKLPNVIVTPHYAPTTREAATAVSRIAGENIVNFLRDGSCVGRIV